MQISKNLRLYHSSYYCLSVHECKGVLCSATRNSEPNGKNKSKRNIPSNLRKEDIKSESLENIIAKLIKNVRIQPKIMTEKKVLMGILFHGQK